MILYHVGIFQYMRSYHCKCGVVFDSFYEYMLHTQECKIKNKEAWGLSSKT